MALSEDQISLMAFNDDPGDWNNLAFRDCWVDGYQTGVRAIEAEVRKQDDALILQLVEALERAKKHHFTTSLPLVIENYGSKIKCANEGSIVWRGLAPAAITAARARLGEKT